MTEAPMPGDHPPTGWDPPQATRESHEGPPDSLTARIGALQRNERRRRRLRTGAIYVAASLVVIGLGTVIALAMTRSSPNNKDVASNSNPTTPASTTSTEGSATTEEPTSTSITTPGSTTPTSAAPEYAPPAKCDNAAITTALLDAPEPYDIDGTPNCSETFWAVPVVVPSDEEKLTVVFEVGPSGPEAIGVTGRDRCTDVATDEPTFDPGLCPS